MSIRLRLTLWYVFLLAVILIIFSGALFAIFAFSQFSEVDHRLQLRANEVSSSLSTALEIQSEPRIFLLRGGRVTIPSANTFATSGVFVEISSLDGVALSRSENLGTQTIAVPSATFDGVANGNSNYLNVLKDNIPLRVYVSPLTVRNQVVAAIVVAESLQGTYDTLRRLAFLMVIGIVGSLVIASVVGAWLAGSALAPIDRITQTAHTIARSNDLTRRIDEKPTKDEVGRLAATFNEMLGRIEELFRAQQRFVADVSHELRSPLTAIRGNLDLLRRGAVAETISPQTALAAIDSEASRMQRLVQDLLLLAQADAGVQIQKQPVELDSLLLDVYHQTKLTTTSVKLALGAWDQVQITGDPDRLKQLFINLIDNAIKYTPAGGEVTLSLGRDGTMACVSVADTGIGIPEKDLPHIFDRFYRVDKARTREQGGTGLGLSISKWIVDQHNGKIEVQSQVGKGTTFTVWLPLARAGL
jgi:heavy metal sensor kinase